MTTAFETYVNPALGGLLRSLKLDVTYTSGKGTQLRDTQDRPVLDFVAAYGALPFGHGHPAMTTAITQALAADVPTMVQPSALDAASRLAHKLCDACPWTVAACVFGNSGAEAVEAAIKVAYAKTGRPAVLSTHQGFHGKTLGALSTTANPGFQSTFFAPLPNFDAVPFNDEDALEAYFKIHGHRLAAFIVEPIQGEAGVRPASRSYLRRARALCSEYGALLIMDEVQTGLGRMGRLFCTDFMEDGPDIITLSKALGGGVIPVAACLITPDAYSEDFMMKHSSTFAGNALASHVGIAVLDLLQDPSAGMLQNVRARSAELMAGLQDIADRHPDIVKEVRGEGLLIGFEFGLARGDNANRFGAYLPIMNEQNALAPIAASYLLNVHGIRVAPTLNGGKTLRIEPPLTVTEAEVAQFLEAMRDTVETIASMNTSALIGHLFEADTPETNHVSHSDKKPAALTRLFDGDATDDARFAFLVHPLDERDFANFDTSLGQFEPHALAAFEHGLMPMVEPFLACSTKVRSKTGVQIHGDFIMVPRTARQMMAAPGAETQETLMMALQIAKDRGAQMCGLGAFTSIVSRGGTAVEGVLPLTTGNSCTMLTSVQAVYACITARGGNVETADLAVVGAAGSIGSAAARLFLADCATLRLIGNPASARANPARFIETLCEAICYIGTVRSSHPLGPLAQALVGRPEWSGHPGDTDGARALARAIVQENGSKLPIYWSSNPADMLPHADAIFVATSNTERFIEPNALKPDAIACDVSRPANLSALIQQERPDVLTIDGGLLRAPHPVDLGGDFGIAEGRVYACMAEAMMLTMEGHFQSTSLGLSLQNDELALMQQLIHKHGFELAAPTSFDQAVDIQGFDSAAHQQAARMAASIPRKEALIA